MGKGIDMARAFAPEHAALLDDLKDQLLIIFLRRLGRSASISIAEMDDTSQELFAFRIDENKTCHFELQRKS